MRKLTARRDDESGVTTVVIALMFTCLVGAAGIGIDTGSLALQRSRVQHSADAGAMAIAYDCASNTEPQKCTDAGGAGTASGFAEQNSGGGSVGLPEGVSRDAGTVLVTVNKTVGTKFFNLFGTASKDVGAKARASWDKQPIGGVVLPFAISLCEFKKHPSGTATEIRSDLNDEVKRTSTYAALSSYLTSCSVPDDVTTLPGSPSTVSMLEGGLWMSLNGNNVCNGKVSSDYSKYYEATAKNETCVKKYESDLVPDSIMLFPIYAPLANYAYAGISGSGTGDSIAVQVVGYAPFKVSGSCLQKSCNRPGIFGKFISSARPVPTFEYGTGAGNFGATKVELKTE